MTVKDILRPVSEDLQHVRHEIEHQLSQISRAALSRFQTVTDTSVHHLFAVHGKYLRPSLVLLTGRVLAERYAVPHGALLKIAAAVEFVHSASLVHDDIIDRADERRDHPSVNAVFGNKTAVLVGDLLYDQSFAVLAGLTELGTQAQLSLFDLFTSTTRTMCLGEIYEDEIVDRSADVSFSDYLRVIDYKTASLMACCCRASAIAVGADDSHSSLLNDFGLHLGRTYQLIDDVVDEDSVFFNREVMLARAVSEATEANSALSTLGESEGAARLAAITHAVLDRAGQTIPG